MTNTQNPKKENSHHFDLEKRTTEFAKEVIRLCVQLPRNPINDRLVGQVAGSAGSIGANYREANDALGTKDFVHKLKISRREAKETIHWLELIVVANPSVEKKVSLLIKEAIELRNILSSIISKVNNPI
ncbi:MAG: hypothetical protein A2849_00670 [Candidatus Taylorbacteria bacterium RIFCSPHIGHO2_01_FULL_51_15]|uniref:Four helix bundle protein n=1 Tax=Candidatus Taylorbacteria bacterium RIFCSPHIGHO2_01_FULL_51_15 TaxID=1802304 RepID=A0A1G2M9R8_9BACT|nr:MAG: hypothetical protein A2849_00670 [Candidatus Taylorbacteria bacterium RIFCSPHIGHO2_01_FULL_51_15]